MAEAAKKAVAEKNKSSDQILHWRAVQSRLPPENRRKGSQHCGDSWDRAKRLGQNEPVFFICGITVQTKFKCALAVVVSKTTGIEV